MILTYRYRLKDGTAADSRALRAQARAVNFVWNFCCETDRKSYRLYKSGGHGRRPSAFDLTNLCRGVTQELGIHSDTIDAICAKFAKARDGCFPKTPRFRSAGRNLDWIPFSNFTRPAKLDGRVLTVLRHRYRLWLSRQIPADANMRAFDFSADNRGRWYINIQIELPTPASRPIETAVGVDLGLKTLATMSDGSTIETPAFYRKAEAQIARMQRFGKKKRVRALAAKVANQRKHFLHVATTTLVRRYDRIVVGDVSPSRLSKTRMAKSIHDAAWTTLRSQLQYKAIAHGAVVQIVNERWSSQTCSACGTVPVSSPKGVGALGMRRWDCSDCGASHDRDVNAARNILRVGLECQPPAGEISVH